jgi:hypothetical protein
MIEIVNISKLKPLELVFPSHLENLSKMLLESGVIKSPILADRKTGIVLDGSHRYIFFLKNGYKNVPVVFVNYEDENIRVGSKLIHRFLIDSELNISKDEVVERGLTGRLFSPRTTRHFFPFRKNEFVNLKLSELEKGDPTDVSRYVANVNVSDEISHNDMYIEEIEYEIDEMIKYMEEVRQTKQYLKKQINLMKKTN